MSESKPMPKSFLPDGFETGVFCALLWPTIVIPAALGVILFAGFQAALEQDRIERLAAQKRWVDKIEAERKAEALKPKPKKRSV